MYERIILGFSLLTDACHSPGPFLLLAQSEHALLLIEPAALSGMLLSYADMEALETAECRAALVVSAERQAYSSSTAVVFPTYKKQISNAAQP